MHAEHKLELEAVLKDLRSLFEVERAALTMKTADGMTCEEITQTISMPASAVKVKVHRARLRLLHSRELSEAASSYAGARS